MLEIREPWAAIAFPYATLVKMEEFREFQAGAAGALRTREQEGHNKRT